MPLPRESRRADRAPGEGARIHPNAFASEFQIPLIKVRRRRKLLSQEPSPQPNF